MQIKIAVLLLLSTTIVLLASIIHKARADTMDDVGCLVEAIYFEARGESVIGMIAVGQVILNRVNDERFPRDVCSVVHAGQYWNNHPVRDRCQFSYWCDGKPERYNDINALDTVRISVDSLLNGVRIEGLGRATHYHASHVAPYWTKNFKRIRQIEGHIFYEPK